MGNIVPIKDAVEALVPFQPQEPRKRDAEADAVIAFAQRMRDWPTLEKAVDQKIADQQEFVEWWGTNVRRAGGDQKSDQKRGPALMMSVVDAERLSGISQQAVSKWRERLGDVDAYRQRLYGPSYRAAMATKGDATRGTTGTGDNEWFTPGEYVELARNVLGAIDLDPASNPLAQEVIKAACYFTKQDNGLTKEWSGRVWLNPPYAQPLIGQFVSKMVCEVRASRVSAGILLTHNYTDTAWFHEAMTTADAVCFTRGRIGFYDPNGVIAAPTQGQAFCYFGTEVQAFAKSFSEIGFVLRTIR